MSEIEQEVLEQALEDEIEDIAAQEPVEGESPLEEEKPIAEEELDVLALHASLEEARAELEKAHILIRERDREGASLLQELSQTTSKYRAALLTSYPEVPPDLVQGQTVEEIDESMARARQMVERIRNQLEAQAAFQRVPTGAPLRSAPDLSARSPSLRLLRKPYTIPERPLLDPR